MTVIAGRRSGIRAIGLGLCLLVSWPDAARAGAVVVESFRPHWAGSAAKLQAGDLVVAAGDRGGRISDAGAPADVWDLLDRQYRSEMLASATLEVQRGQETLTLELPAAPWGVEFRPAPAAGDEAVLRKQGWSALARRLEGRSDWSGAAWAWMRASEQALGSGDAAASRRHLDEALESARCMPESRAEPFIWMRRGWLAVDRWNGALAVEAWTEAGALLEKTSP